MRRNWLIYALTFSFAINGATAAALILFWAQDQSMAAASIGQKTMGGFLQEDLKLSTEQTNSILILIDKSKQEVMGLRAQMASRRAELMKLISSVPVSKEAVAAKMDEIGRTQSQIRAAAVNTVVTIVESLPPESRDKFGEYIQARGRACDVVEAPTGKGVKAVLDAESQRGRKK